MQPNTCQISVADPSSTEFGARNLKLPPNLGYKCAEISKLTCFASYFNILHLNSKKIAEDPQRLCGDPVCFKYFIAAPAEKNK